MRAATEPSTDVPLDVENDHPATQGSAPVERSRREALVTLWTERTGAVVVVGLAAAAILSYVVIAVLRMRFPYDLEWMEGGSVGVVRQIDAGHPVYGPPTVDYTPFIYTPLYYYVGWAVSHVMGIGYTALRLVSFVSSLVAFGLLFLLVRRERRDWVAGLAAVGVFAAGYRFAGAWLDISRTDSLSIALMLGSMLVARRSRTWRGAIIAGVLLFLAFFTKQTMLIGGAAVAVWLIRRSWSAGLAFLATLGVALGGSTLLMDHLTDGWYSFYAWHLPEQHPKIGGGYLQVLDGDLLPHCAVALVLLAVVVVIGLTRPHEGGPSAARWFYPFVVLALLGAAVIGRDHSGGYDNVLLPGVLAFAIAAGVLVGEARHGEDALRIGRPAAAIAVYLACIAQFVVWGYDPSAQVPTSADLSAGRQLDATITSLPGPVWIPGHPWLASRLGKGTVDTQSFTELDVQRSADQLHTAELNRSISRAVADQRWGAVIVDTDPHLDGLPANFDKYYVQLRPVFDQAGVLFPRTGAYTRPETVYVRRPQP